MEDEAARETIAAYDADAEMLAGCYESHDADAHHARFADLLPSGPDRIALDVGAGSGRDAAWLAELGYDVVAAEPSGGMRTAGQARHGDTPIRWIDDRLPGLDAVHGLGLSFDLILLSAVWQHVAPGERRRAFRKLTTLLRPGGLLVLTLRHGPAPTGRPMHEVSVGEIEGLAREHGLLVNRVAHGPDVLGRPGVSWTTMCLTLPDDGAGALPLIRGIILNDDKSATYKLGLLRSIAKIADVAPSLGTPCVYEDRVLVPLGAVALNWVRMYLPLVARGVPQMPRNAGPDGLGFAKEGFRSLLAIGLVGQDLRIGATFSGERALAVARALSEAARTIGTMPANFIRFPNSDQRVFGVDFARAGRSSQLSLDVETLRAFGTLSVPGHVWRAMQRLGAWIEPVLVAEWARLTRTYAERSGQTLAIGEVEAALAWADPARDVRMARDAALMRMGAGERLHCVWSDRRLSPDSFDIDHCLPWSAWPCSDLWNLLPAHRTVNQRQKRDLLPSSTALAGARTAIIAWWDDAWRAAPVVRARFEREVGAALPVLGDAGSADIFAALEWRRLKLRQDQQVAEWSGLRVPR